MTPGRLCDLAEAYAIGALEPDEVRVFEAHLAGCPDCPGVVRAQREVVVLLAQAAPSVEPGPQLRARVLQRFREEHRVVLPVRRGVPLAGLAWAAAVAGLAIAGGALWRAHRTTVELAGVRATLERREGMLNAVLDASTAMYRLNPSADSLSPAGAQLFWSRDQHVWLLHAFNLPRLPEGRAYQLWFVTPAARIAAGVLDPDSLGHALLRVSVPPEAAGTELAAITLEPAGGSAQPTGPIVLAGNVATKP